MMGHEDVGAPDRRPHPGSPADKGKPEATQGRKATGPHEEVSRVAEVESGMGRFRFAHVTSDAPLTRNNAPAAVVGGPPTEELAHLPP